MACETACEAACALAIVLERLNAHEPDLYDLIRWLVLKCDRWAWEHRILEQQFGHVLESRRLLGDLLKKCFYRDHFAGPIKRHHQDKLIQLRNDIEYWIRRRYNAREQMYNEPSPPPVTPDKAAAIRALEKLVETSAQKPFQPGCVRHIRHKLRAILGSRA